LRAMIKSSVNEMEFVLHFPESYDMRLLGSDRDTLFNLINLRFAKLNPHVTLKVYLVVSFASTTAPSLSQGLPHHTFKQKAWNFHFALGGVSSERRGNSV